MRKLILVRHSASEVIPHLPPKRRPLSEEGRRRCQVLTQLIAHHKPGAVFATVGPKAIETGRIVAGILDIPFQTIEGLAEHDRNNANLTKEQDEAQVARFFENANCLVFGLETANQAHESFSRAVTALMETCPEDNLVVVAYGIAITLVATRANGLAPMPFWKSLVFPSFVVLSWPSLQILEIVESVDSGNVGL